MKKKTIIIITLMLAAACSSPSTPAVDPNNIVPTSTPFPTAEYTAISTIAQEMDEPVQETPIPVETAGPNCMGDEIVPMGQTIADDYPFSSYEQVMTWFCNGAEFGDIITALETESQTGFSADEMLHLLSQGFTWEDIWQHIGILD